MARMTTRIGLTMGAALMAALAAQGLCFQALAQQKPPPPAVPAPADPAEAAARAAFEAMPEADRRAIQEALVWTGDYSGVTDGSFGRGTFAAIKAYQLKKKAKNDGVLTPLTRSTLLAEGAKAREALGFTVLDDPRTGVRIGVPQRLLAQRTQGKTGSVFKGKDAFTSLETFAEDPTRTTLAALFQAGIGDASRKVTYKLSRPDFFVIAGETAGKRFYTRAASGAAGIRGFIFIYAPRPDLDRVTIAIANSFVPFPAAAAPSAGAKTVPPPIPAVPKPAVHLTGIAISPREMLTAILPESCTLPTVGGAALKIKRVNQEAGLTLLERAEGAASVQPLVLRAADLQAGDGVVVLSASGDGAANVSVAAGEARSASRILAPLQAPSGSAVFDRTGALAGIVAFQSQIKALPGGIVPAANYSLAVSPAIKPFLPAGSGGVSDVAGDASAGAIAARYGRAIVAVNCGG